MANLSNKPKQIMRQSLHKLLQTLSVMNQTLHDPKITAKNSQRMEKIGYLGCHTSLNTYLLSKNMQTFTQNRNIHQQLIQSRAKAKEASEIKMFRGEDWKACLFMWENPSSDALCREKTDMKNEQQGRRASCCLALEWKNLAYDECVRQSACVRSRGKKLGCV